MSKEDMIALEGEVVDIQKERFTISTQNGNVIGYVSGKMKVNKMRIVLGDRVKVEVSPYDLSKGRITYRFPAGKQ
jgi:translation initiation factor IF-1